MTLSQNFIKSNFLVSQLIEYSSLNKDDLVVEIGPGRGIITKGLVDKVREVIVIEKDEILYQRLIEEFGQISNLKIVNKDFLHWYLPNKPYKVFSNIPFNITAEIIDKLLKAENKPLEIYLVIQTEAAEKYIGDLELETQSSILAKIFYDVEIVGDLDRTAFTPKPQINISFIKFTLKPDINIDSSIYQQFRDFVIFGFNQWKSDIFNAYKKVFSYQQFKLINKKLKINQLKPSQLSLNQWEDFFDIFQKFVPSIKKDIVLDFENKYLKKIRVKK